MAEPSPESTASSSSLLHVLLVYLGLAVATLAVYAQVRNFQFVNWDDELFISSNPFVTGGLTGENIAWAFGIHGPGQYHPIAWLVHQLNCELFGLEAGYHHLVNVLLHIAVSLVLLTALWRLTSCFWPSALVAALHAIHPLSVQSVAWASHLREPLSMLFWGLVMWSYASYARRGGLQRYLLVLLLFAMGLMAKPTLMTLPCVLLLLDYWPLNRLAWGPSSEDEAQTHQPLSKLVLEKIPFFALAGVSVWLAYLCQQSMGSVVSLESIPLGSRLSNAAQSYALYLRNMVWPLNLATAYPLQKSFYLPLVAGSTVLLVAISAAVWRFRFQRRYLLVGWLWYLGTLVPVIGLVRMGSPTAMPDHYMYVSLLGIYIVIAWLLAEWVQHRPDTKSIVVGAVIVLFMLLLPLTWRQVAFWRNGETLWTRSLAVTKDNSIAHNNFASIVQPLGRTQEALQHAKEALRIRPNYVEAHVNLGVAVSALDRPQEAVSHYQKALQLNPKYAEAHYNLGNAMLTLNRPQEAAARFKDTIDLKPNLAPAHNNYGGALHQLGRSSEAISHFENALRLKPDYSEAHNNLGNVLQALGRQEDAVAHHLEALRIEPGNFGASFQCGVALHALGRTEEAITYYQKALKINPKHAKAHFNCGVALRKLNRLQEAIPHYQEALRLKPDDAEAHNNLGNLLQRSGRLEEAVVHYLETLRINSDHFEANYNCGIALQTLGRSQESLERFERALQLKSNSAEVHYRLAWALATSPEEAVRDGERAVKHARWSIKLTRREHPFLFDVLAAAHAESRQFAEAVKWQKKAVELAKGDQKKVLSARLELYQQGKPYRDSKDSN